MGLWDLYRVVRGAVVGVGGCSEEGVGCGGSSVAVGVVVVGLHDTHHN